MASRWWRALRESLLKGEGSDDVRLVTYTLGAMLYLVGAQFWIGFYNSGRVLLAAHDWVKEAAYLETLRRVVTSGVIPFQWSEAYYHPTSLFLANPEVLWTPDVILLRWLSGTQFVMVHTLLLYTAGFVGSALLARRARAGVAAFFTFWLLFNFNGYITSHLTAGHFQWTGYFLLPLFLVSVVTVLLRPQERQPRFDVGSFVWLSLVMGALIWNGSFHIAIWCVAFLGLMACVRWSLALTLAAAMAAGVILGAGRFVPAALFFPSLGGFITGYPTLGMLLHSLTVQEPLDFVRLFPGVNDDVGYWEYDAYVSWVALLWLLVGGGYFLRRVSYKRMLPALVAGGVLLVLSYGDIYALVSRFLPLVGNSEAVSSRFIALPFVLLLFLAMKGTDIALKKWPTFGLTALVVLGSWVAWDLAGQAAKWNVAALERAYQDPPAPVLSIVPPTDGRYVTTVIVSWVISSAALALLAGFAWWWHRTRTHQAAAPKDATA